MPEGAGQLSCFIFLCFILLCFHLFPDPLKMVENGPEKAEVLKTNQRLNTRQFRTEPNCAIFMFCSISSLVFNRVARQSSESCAQSQCALVFNLFTLDYTSGSETIPLDGASTDGRTLPTTTRNPNQIVSLRIILSIFPFQTVQNILSQDVLPAVADTRSLVTKTGETTRTT